VEETIYKYIINPNNEEILMPAGAEVLSVAFQRDDFCLWAKVDPKAPACTRKFIAFGTGHLIPPALNNSLKFIGTGFTGPYVFHAFEIVE
jgi:hypothetical protein